MHQILLVEDSAMIGRLTKKKLENVFDVPVFWVKTMKETCSLLKQADGNFSMALLDVNLPDAPHGEVIDEVIKWGISTFVFTSNLTEEVRQLVWSKQVADYILKDDPNSLDYIVRAMRRVEENTNVLVLVVGGLDNYRAYLSELLYVQKYRVITAKDGKAALQILDKYKEVKLVIAGYYLEDMDGWMFCQKVREKFKHDDLAILGLTAAGEGELGPRFLKSGANDFLEKDSFLVEEFYCRVNQCVENIQLIQEARDASIKDHLTGLFNRRYLFSAGNMLLSSAKREQIDLVCAIIDIDHFKNINDTHGHNIGDLVLQYVAKLLPEKMRQTDIVARIGGEEFCILAVNMSFAGAKRKFEELRQRVEEMVIPLGKTDGSTSVTVSIGVCATSQDTLENYLKAADLLLYKAKAQGRNRVEMSAS